MSNYHYINILKAEISYAEERIDINKLKFYEKNPRVLSKLSRSGKLNLQTEEKQSVIFEQLKNETSVQKLLKSIPKAGGITEPLVVQQDTLEVLEGNSRLTALLMLAEKYDQDIRYLTAPCRLVKLNEEQIDSFLDQLHVEGKTSWTAYDKAYSSYQRVVVDGVTIDEYAERIVATPAEIKKRVRAVEFMIEEGTDEKTDTFSYYDVMVRSRKLGSSLDGNSELKSYLLGEIKKKKPAFTAAEMRDDIPTIAEKPKIQKKLIEGTIDFETAREQATPSTPKKHIAKALRNLKEVSRNDLKPLSSNDRNAVINEVRKCRKEVQRITSILDSSNDQ